MVTPINTIHSTYGMITSIFMYRLIKKILCPSPSVDAMLSAAINKSQAYPRFSLIESINLGSV
jgi:hypothetical protein